MIPRTRGLERFCVSSSVDWESLLESNRAWLRTVILARGARNADEADDIFQNVALAAVRQAAPIQEKAKAVPWLYALAVNQTALYCRTNGRYRKRVEPFAPDAPEPVSKQTEPIDWLLREERKRLVRESLDRLAPENREILLLKYVHNWSYKEMAEKLGVSVPAIQTRLHRARALLKTEIEKNETK